MRFGSAGPAFAPPAYMRFGSAVAHSLALALRLGKPDAPDE
jgi:hypothetical protein